jgi:hypothetical protein
MDGGAKRKRDYESGADVIGAALSRMEEAAAPAARGASFVAAPAFAGPRPGYYFGRGAQGVGYYADARSGGAAASRGGSMPPPPPRSADAQARRLPAHHSYRRSADHFLGTAAHLRRIAAWLCRKSSALVRPNAARCNRQTQAMPPPPARAPAAPSGAQLLEAAERDASGIEARAAAQRTVARQSSRALVCARFPPLSRPPPAAAQVDELDVRAVRRAVLGLERRLNENLAARVKARASLRCVSR